MTRSTRPTRTPNASDTSYRRPRRPADPGAWPLAPAPGVPTRALAPTRSPRLETPAQSMPLKLANAVAIDTLDPVEASANESISLDQNIYARLVQTDPAGKEIVPDLADKWDISDDKLTYTFHLRPDVKFADGTPVTAQDAKWSIERARDGEDSAWGFLLHTGHRHHGDR